jgi:hypothetical protein
VLELVAVVGFGKQLAAEFPMTSLELQLTPPVLVFVKRWRSAATENRNLVSVVESD